MYLEFLKLFKEFQIESWNSCFRPKNFTDIVVTCLTIFRQRNKLLKNNSQGSHREKGDILSKYFLF